MTASILQSDVQAYINQNLTTDPTSLVLKGVPFTKVTTVEVVEQIEAKNRCEKKLPTWFQESNIYYPNKLNIEQTSSEVTASYKSGLIAGNSLIDITGGFGVDTYYFAKSFKDVVHCELNADLSKIVKHNYQALKVNNIKTFAEDGLAHLKNASQTFDWIYVDPSRRHDSKGKVFFLRDCLPNIPEHLDVLWSHSKNVMLKVSPLLDITSGLNELEYVKAIHVVAVNNEVKELLWILEYGFSGQTTIKTINLKKTKAEAFNFFHENESLVEPSYQQPLSYLYEPNSAIMKSGGFNSLLEKFKVKKLHKHSHLYTSDELVDFPGRRFKISKVIPYNKKEIKRLSISKANITIRNFPDTVKNIRKSLKIKDGGALYLFFTTTFNDEKVVLICKKVI